MDSRLRCRIGFTHSGVPTVNAKIIRAFASDIPAAVIVLLIEHIAISKSFGRVNNYRINPSQEMVAIGVTNLLGPFLGGYPSTGSFSRTAIKSKAGVRTPIGGIITAVVVLLAIYALPAVFFYIPSASLSAVIIHAVGDLITPPNTLYRFWRVSPFEVLIWFVGVLVTVFSTIENGIYCTICLSFAVYLFRILRSRGRFLGRVPVHSVLGDHVIGGGSGSNEHGSNYGTFNDLDTTTNNNNMSSAVRDVFLPMNHDDGSNPDLDVANPYPGVFIYRLTEGFNYPTPATRSSTWSRTSSSTRGAPSWTTTTGQATGPGTTRASRSPSWPTRCSATGTCRRSRPSSSTSAPSTAST
jgi:solute carrier family 26 (sodium-independent sulfate anion transporter), member 11